MALVEGAVSTGGALVTPEYTNKKKCPKCGAMVDLRVARCPNCGAAMKEFTAAAAFTADFDIKSVTEQGDGTLVLVGYGNTWEEDRDGETTAKDAFSETVPEFLQNPVLLLNHDRNRVIGQVKQLVPDEVGLRILAEVPKPPDGAEAWHKTAYEWVKKGILRAFSMGGLFHRSKTVSGLISKVNLYEMSIVTIPANASSLFTLAAIKGFDGFEQKCGCEGKAYWEAELDGKAPSQAQREAWAKSGAALPDGSYPITSCNGPYSVANAVQAIGRASDPGRARAHIRKRAAALGCTDLIPDSWKDFEVADAKWGTGQNNNPTGHNQFRGGRAGRYARRTGTRHRHRSGLVHSHAGGFKPHRHNREAALELEEDPEELVAVEYTVDTLLEELNDEVVALVDDQHLSDKQRVEQLSLLLSDFVEEAQELLPSEDQPKFATAVAKLKEAHVPDEPQNQPAAGGDTKGAGDGNVITIDKKEWEATQKVLSEMAAEHNQRKMEKEAEALAEKRLKEQQEREAAEAKAAKEREDELTKLADQIVQKRLAAMTGGRKHVWQGDGAPVASGPRPKQKGLADWMRALVRSKKGDPEAFKFLVEGHDQVAAEYGYKAYNEGTNAAGGFLVPPQYLQNGIAEFRLAQAKVRGLVQVIGNITSNQVLIPRETGISSVGWTAENAAKPSTDATYGQISVGIYTLAGIAKVSNQLLEDSTPAVDSIVRRGLGKALGQAEDLAFINGSGVGQPTGILQTAGILTGAVGSKLWSSIAAAITSIQSNYFGNPTAILAHPRDVNTLRTTTDSNGRPIFLPNYWAGGDPHQGGPQAFLGGGAVDMQAAVFSASAADGYVFGLPVYSDANIPTNLGGSSNETRLIVGVWDEAWLFERDGISMDVSNEAGTSFESNQTWFRAEERVGFTAARQPSAFYVMTGLTAGAGL